MKKILTGTITSVKMKNTVVVKVSRTLRHPLYHKIIKKSKTYKAHVGSSQKDLKLGDIVHIQEVRPISKDIRFKVIEK